MEPPAQDSSHAQWVLSELNQQRGLGKFCNVTLITHDGQVFLAHCNVLACFSKLLQDTTSSKDSMELNLPPECTSEGLELLLQFVYTGQLQLNSDNKTKLRHAASALRIPDSLIHGHDLTGMKAFESREEFEPAPNRPDLTGTRRADSQSSLESKTEDLEMSVAVTEESVSNNPGTTTRSGRRVRGPSRLVGESHVPVVSKQSHRRKREAEVKIDLFFQMCHIFLADQVRRSPSIWLVLNVRKCAYM